MTDESYPLVRGSCSKCGSEQISYDDELGDDAILTCVGCGASLGTRGEFVEAATKLAKEEILPDMIKELQKAFKL